MAEKQKTKEVDLGVGSVGKLLFNLAVPAIAAQIINVLYNMVDRMYIGHLPGVGANALTGVGITFPIITAISAFAALVSMGGAPRASIMLGKGDKDMAERILGNCASALIIVSIVLTVFLQIFGRQILMIFGASENTIDYAWEYMQIYALGTISVQLTLGLNAFINAQGYAKMGMFTVVIGAILNIILDPVLMFVFDMGVAGAAWATIISQTVSAIWVVWFLLSRKSYLRLRPGKMRIQGEILLPAIALGSAPFVMQFTESILNVCFNTSLQRYGQDMAVGAMTICSSVMQFCTLPLSGMCQGGQPLISFNYGAGKIKRVEKTFYLLLATSLGYSTLMWVLSMFTPNLFTSVFTQDAALTDYTVWAMRIYMAMSLLMGAQLACQQTFIALGDSKTSLFLALLRKVILLIPLIYILPLFIENKVMAVFLAEPIADTIAICTTVTLFFRALKKLKKKGA